MENKEKMYKVLCPAQALYFLIARREEVWSHTAHSLDAVINFVDEQGALLQLHIFPDVAWTSCFVMIDGSEERFFALCKELGVGVEEHTPKKPTHDDFVDVR